MPQRHILSGSSFEREIAAFLVDATSHGSSDDDDVDTFGRCGVPITTRAELSHPGIRKILGNFILFLFFLSIPFQWRTSETKNGIITSLCATRFCSL